MMKIDIGKIKVGRIFKMTDVTKADQCSQYQPNTTVKNGKAFQTMQVIVTWIEDRGAYLYIGFKPNGKDIGRCGFGATRIYKKEQKEYGTLGFEAIYNYQ